jgi:transposase
VEAIAMGSLLEELTRREAAVRQRIEDPNDGRKLDHKTLETLRIRAVRQIEDGAHPEDVAEVLGLDRSTVFKWLARYREGGIAALKAKPVPGRPSKLDGRQIARLYALIVGSDPRQLQFDFALWTREMVRQVIRAEFKVALSVVSVGRLLKKMGSTPRPAAASRRSTLCRTRIGSRP